MTRPLALNSLVPASGRPGTHEELIDAAALGAAVARTAGERPPAPAV